MDIIKAGKNRRSIRKYKRKKVPRKILKKILDSARWAPSLHNMQPWRFIIPGGAMREKVIRALKKRRRNEPLIIRLTLKNGVEIIENAPLIILVYNTGALSNRVKKGGRIYFNNANISEIQSVACAIQNMLLTVYSLGLGAAWIGISSFREKEINKTLGIKDRLMAILTIGYPSKKSKAPRRKAISEIAFFLK